MTQFCEKVHFDHCFHGLRFSRGARRSLSRYSRFAVTGTPGDCIAVALGHLLNHDKPDLILSGVNRGAQVIEQLMAMEWPQDVCLNVNFPSCAPSAVLPLKITRQGRGYLEGGGPCARKRPAWSGRPLASAGAASGT